MKQYIDIHTHDTIKRNNITIVNASVNLIDDKNIFYSVGIHPWDIKDINVKEKLNAITIKIRQPNIKAIGEIGLDRYINTPIEDQIALFKSQRKLAEDHNKPIIIHCVKAYSDFLNILKKYPPQTPWIFHGFNANTQIARKLISFNCYLSFGEMLLSNSKVQKTFAAIPLERLFLETDDSPISIEDIYLKAAELKEIPLQDIKEMMHINFNKIFPQHSIT